MHMRCFIAIFTCLLCGSIVWGEDVWVEDLSIQPTGWMSMPDGVEIGLDHWGKEWSCTRQVLGAFTPEKGFPQVSDKTWALQGSFAGFTVTETITSLRPDTIRYQATARSDKPVETERLSLSITLPTAQYAGKTLVVDGKNISLPAKLSSDDIFQAGHFNSIVIPMQAGRLVLRCKTGVFIQDERKWEWDRYAIRLLFAPNSGPLKASSIDVTIELQPWDTKPIDIRSQANMAFADEAAVDGKGGWTDQGSENDLSSMPLGKQRFGGVQFDIIDPATNGGKSCLVFAGPERDYFLKTATIPCNDAAFSDLYLLHGIAWAPTTFEKIGDIQIDYADGSQETKEVQFDRDVSNWWNPLSTDQGDLVWTAKNPQSYIGLFLTRFSVQNKPIRQITLRGTGKAVWMIAGISGGESVPRRFRPAPLYTVAGKDWTPIEHSLTVESDSIMDWSNMHHAPAGKFGRLIQRNGYFVFENAPDQRVRFYGVNLCFSANYQDKASCERLADNLSRMGCNAVRFHHYDSGLASYSRVMNPENLDKLEYLFYCMKQRGIYVVIDLYSDRAIGDGIIKEIEGGIHMEYRAVVAVSPSAMEDWKNFARNLLTHVNPYTKLAWKDDPALGAICVLNESNIGFWWDRDPRVKRVYDQRFEEWLQDHKRTGLDATQRAKAFQEFLADVGVKKYRECAEFIRSLGCQTLLSDANFDGGHGPDVRLLRAETDFGENHCYFSHILPVHRHDALPYKCDQSSNLEHRVPLMMIPAPTRTFGRPFMLTEYNQPFANQYRAESGVLVGAYGGLQDWDGLFRFAYSHNDVNTQIAGPTTHMELSQDPLTFLSDRLAILMMVRGDVQPAKKAVPFLLTKQALDFAGKNFDWGGATEYRDLGLVHRIGQWPIDDARHTQPTDILYAVGYPPKREIQGVRYHEATKAFLRALLAKCTESNGNIVSDTGEISLNSKTKELAVVTDRTECFILPEKRSSNGQAVKVFNEGPHAVVSVSAMEGDSIRDSRRLLVLHMTDVSNTLAKFYDKDRIIIEEWGNLPHLVHTGRARVEIQHANDEPVTVWAITISGRRLNPVSTTREGDCVVFTVNTDQPEGGCMAYEVEFSSSSKPITK